MHWYGFYHGPRFYWTRWYRGFWWYYDSGPARWTYWWHGYWWWPGPANVVYVNVNGAYQPYPPPSPEVQPAPASAPAAPAAPGTVNPGPAPEQVPTWESSHEDQVGEYPSLKELPGPPPAATPPPNSVMPPPPPEPGGDDSLPGEWPVPPKPGQ
ncbi:MAG: hypothetical protein NTX64_02700 [Elusimicrobia bacterium]|nr:hypothetical protein [Elusimicrobiota bacterium]